jgi:hypothetical protein
MTSPAIKEDAMTHSRVQRGRCWAVLAGTLWLAAAVQPASAQSYMYGGRHADGYAPHPPPCAPAPWPGPSGTPAPSTLGTPVPAPGAAPSTPGTPPAPGQQEAAPSMPSPADVAGGPEASAAGGGEAFAAAQGGVGGYIDSAIPMTMFRLRFDAAYNNNRPDRAEFFYAKCGCLRVPTAGAFFDPKAAGPGPAPETNVDYQELRSYFEVAVNPHLSVFLEVPYRWINPDQNANANGFGDLEAGFKYAFIACEGRYLTFQLKVYTPTGDSFKGLGTDHTSVEPGILWQTCRERWTFFGEVRDWIATDGSDFSGNVIRYGVGVGYDVYRSCSWRITPVLEGVGWTVISGKESVIAAVPVENAAGDTIVNVKLGVRANYGEHSSFYVGYGRALTGDVWYKDIWRVEYRLTF